jgi:hypothetical protein
MMKIELPIENLQNELLPDRKIERPDQMKAEGKYYIETMEFYIFNA